MTAMGDAGQRAQPSRGSWDAPAGGADAVLDALGVAVVLADTPGMILGWNEAAATLLGWQGPDPGRALTDILERHMDAGEAAGVLAHVAGGSTWRADIAVQTGSRQRSVVDAVISPVRGAGQPEEAGPQGVAGIVLVASDVSERMERSADLGLRTERLRRFVRHTSEVVITLEDGSTIGFASAAVERVLGVAPNELA